MLMQLAVGCALMTVLGAMIMVFIHYPTVMVVLFFLAGAYAIGHIVMSEYYLWKGL